MLICEDRGFDLSELIGDGLLISINIIYILLVSQDLLNKARIDFQFRFIVIFKVMKPIYLVIRQILHDAVEIKHEVAQILGELVVFRVADNISMGSAMDWVWLDSTEHLKMRDEDIAQLIIPKVQLLVVVLCEFVVRLH